jgi:hypothetical protein
VGSGSASWQFRSPCHGARHARRSGTTARGFRSHRLRKNLPSRVHPVLLTLEPSIRKTLNPREAYNMVPGRNHRNG